MPMGIMGVVMIPFGFDGLFWQLMGVGIDWMVWVAQWVTGLPGAVGRMQAFGTGPLLAGTAGLLLLCLLRTPLRLTGAAVLFGAILWALTDHGPTSSSPMTGRRPPSAVPTGDFQFCAARATASHSKSGLPRMRTRERRKT